MSVLWGGGWCCSAAHLCCRVAVVVAVVGGATPLPRACFPSPCRTRTPSQSSQQAWQRFLLWCLAPILLYPFPLPASLVSSSSELLRMSRSVWRLVWVNDGRGRGHGYAIRPVEAVQQPCQLFDRLHARRPPFRRREVGQHSVSPFLSPTLPHQSCPIPPPPPRRKSTKMAA